MAGNLASYIDPPEFFDGTELSAVDYNILEQNAEVLKVAATMSKPVFNIHRGINITNNNGWIFRGGFQYRVGLTDAVLVIYTKQVSGMGNHDIAIYFNGVEVDRYNIITATTLNVGGTVTRTIPIDTGAYDDYEIVTVEVKPELISGSGDASSGIQYVLNAYTTPYSGIDLGVTWPGVPTFGTITAARLNQLADAERYLAERLHVLPLPLSTGISNWAGTGNPKYTKFRFFNAKFTNSNPRLITRVFYFCKHTSAKIRVNVGGLTFDYGPYAFNSYTVIDIDIDLEANGLTASTDYLASLEEVVVTPAPAEALRNPIFSRISNGDIYFDDPSRLLTVTTNGFAILETATYTQTQGYLNAVKTMVNTINTLMGTETATFNNGVMFRSRYSKDAEQEEYFTHTFLPVRRKRLGEVLWVKGQGVKIAYGPMSVDPGEKGKANNDVWSNEWLYEEEIIGGDKVDQTYVFLDSFEGLYVGQPYWIVGKDIIYAAEHISVRNK
jgi:hypothetical protein